MLEFSSQEVINLLDSFTSVFNKLQYPLIFGLAPLLLVRISDLSSDPSAPICLFTTFGETYDAQVFFEKLAYHWRSKLCCHKRLLIEPSTTDSALMTNLRVEYPQKLHATGKPLSGQRGIDLIDEDVALQLLLWVWYYTSVVYLHKGRYIFHNDVASLDKAVDVLHDAMKQLNLLPRSRVKYGGLLLCLGTTLRKRFRELKLPSDFDNGLQCIIQASYLADYGSELYAECLIGLAMIIGMKWRSNFCLQDLDDTIALLEEIVDLDGLEMRIADIPTYAASHAIRRKKLIIAVEWLERGRSIVWGQMVQFHSSFDVIRDIDADLAERLRELGGELSACEMSSEGVEVEKYRRLVAEWEKVLALARDLPGFENFLLPKTFHELSKALADSVVVIVNITPLRSHALIVRRNDIMRVDLHFSQSQVIALETLVGRMAIEATASRATLRGAEQIQCDDLNVHRVSRKSKAVSHRNMDLLETLLLFLWSRITRPVLDALNVYVCIRLHTYVSPLTLRSRSHQKTPLFICIGVRRESFHHYLCMQRETTVIVPKKARAKSMTSSSRPTRQRWPHWRNLDPGFLSRIQNVAF